MSNDLIHEVEESIKQERLEQIWKEYGSYIIATAILIVLFTGLINGWQAWNAKTNTAQTTAIMSALDTEDIPAALANITHSLRPGHQAIAHLTAAGLLTRDGQNEKALSHYKQAANTGNMPEPFRGLATLMAVKLEWTLPHKKTDTAALLTQLQPLWENKDKSWQFHARLQASLITAHDLEDYETARQYLAVILMPNNNASQSLKDRAQALDHLYNIKIAAMESQTPPETQKEEPEG